MKSYTTRRNQYGDLSSNSTTANLSRGDILMNDCDRRLVNKFKMNEKTDTSKTTVAATQSYLTPYNYDELINLYVTIGGIRYTPREITDRQTWDRLNQMNYASNIPEWYYLYDDHFELLPIPSTSGYTITQNYKITHRDLSQADYATGTVAVTTNTTAVTGTATVWTSAIAGRWMQIAPGAGDNEWYQIASVTNATSLVLVKPYHGATVAGGTYTIGEMSIVDPKYHDIPLYYALTMYYASKVKEVSSYKMYKEMYGDLMKDLISDMSSKSASPVIDPGEYEDLINPNLTIQF